MPQDTVVMPAVRIPKKLWKSLEEIMRKRMFSGRAELMRDALREYVLRHEATVPEFRISEAALTLREGRAEDRKREEELIEWVRKIRT
jgi:metal-responsive CopG/Arc/MetJ family transcriptional regulator